MNTTRYLTFSKYNAWANRRIYASAAELTSAQYTQDGGAFFGSVHATLNHLLVTDQIWMHRFTGTGPLPPSLDTILFETLPALTAARAAEDARIVAFTEALDEAELAAEIRYANSSGVRTTQPLHTALDHLFNHQTHHRGQVHCLLSGFLGKAGTPSLDLIYFMRESGLGGVRAQAPTN